MKHVFSPHKFNHMLGVGILFTTDILTLLIIFYLSGFAREFLFPSLYPGFSPFIYSIEMYYWIFVIWIFILVYEGAYTRRLTLWDEIKFLWKCTFFATLTIMTVLFIGKPTLSPSRLFVLSMSLMTMVFFPLARITTKRIIYSMGLLKRKILIMGAGTLGKDALHTIRNEPNLGYQVVGFVDDDPLTVREIEGIKVHGKSSRLERYFERCGIHDILIAKSDMDKHELSRVINRLQHRVENTLYIPDLSGVAVLGTELRHFFHSQSFVIEIKNNLSNPGNYIAKRIFDFTFGAIFLLVMAVPMLILSVLIKTSSKGPIILRQERIGKNGKRFICYKFRTMYIDAEDQLKKILEEDNDARTEWESYWKLKNDPRITSVGKFLRNSSLDELPQIINVLKGEMSLVGPRPYLPREEKFLQDYGDVILNAPPGITGLWQTYGRSDKTYQERLSLDSWYVRNWNLWLDLVILMKTALVVVKREGGY